MKISLGSLFRYFPVLYNFFFLFVFFILLYVSSTAEAFITADLLLYLAYSIQINFAEYSLFGINIFVSRLANQFDEFIRRTEA